MKNTYYDGTKLLSMKDLNGETPEIFIVTSNRSAGKTTYFGRLLVNRFLKNKEKFALLYRFNYELDDVSEKFFKDIEGLFFNGYTMQSERKASGIFHNLYLVKKSDNKKLHCGYAISLNSADQLKKYSHLFSDVSRILFDEFQSETNHYCSDEVRKFISIHTSIARGQGKQVRYVPVYMLSNSVSLINPYFTELGISTRLNSDSKFIRGNGYVLEQNYNESVSEKQKESMFNTAFSQNQYVEYSTQNTYLQDNIAFIETPVGKSKYLGTFKYEGRDFALRQFPDLGIIYCDDRPDTSYKYKISVTTKDHNINYIMLKENNLFISNMKHYFIKGCFRFRNLICKEALLKMISL